MVFSKDLGRVENARTEFKERVKANIAKDANAPDPDSQNDPIDIDDDSVDLDKSEGIGTNAGTVDPGESDEGSQSIMDIINPGGTDGESADQDTGIESQEPKPSGTSPSPGKTQGDKGSEPPAIDMNAKITMKDGSQLTVKELIDGNMMRRDYTQKTQQIADVLRSPEKLIRYYRDEAGIDLTKFGQQQESKPKFQIPDDEDMDPNVKKLYGMVGQILENQDNIGGRVKRQDDAFKAMENQRRMEDHYRDFSALKENNGLEDIHFPPVFAIYAMGMRQYNGNYSMQNAMNDFVTGARSVKQPADFDYSSTIPEGSAQAMAIFEREKARLIREKKASLNDHTPVSAGSNSTHGSGGPISSVRGNVKSSKPGKRLSFQERRKEMENLGLIGK